MNYIELGPVPAEESCAQVGAPDYERNARRECGVFRRMLERLFPVPEDVDARFTVRQYPHDFGSYFEVCVAYGARAGIHQHGAVGLRVPRRIGDPLALGCDRAVRARLV